jgi:hypothetical protein
MDKVEIIWAGIAFVAGWVLERPALVKKVIGKVVNGKPKAK